MFDGLLLLRTQIVEENGKHIGITGDGITLNTIDAVMYKGLFRGIPECRFQLGFQGGSQFFIFLLVGPVSHQPCTERHGLKTPAEQNLLKRKFSLFIQITVGPVYKYPITGHTFNHTVPVGASQYIIHHSLHTRIELIDELPVTTIQVIIVDAEKPIECIIHNRIAMTGHRIFTPKQPDSTLHRLTVKEEIVVHQITLNGVSAPHPTITLDAVDEELAGGEVHGVGTHFPDAVQLFVVATEISTIFFGKVFVLHGYFAYLHARFVGDVDVAESFAILQGILVFGRGRGCTPVFGRG